MEQLIRNRSYIDAGFTFIGLSFRIVVDSLLTQEKGINWNSQWLVQQDRKGGYFDQTVPNEKHDVRTILKVLANPSLKNFWKSHNFNDAEITIAKRLLRTRNDFAHYNPKFNRLEVVSNTLINIEALLRWNRASDYQKIIKQYLDEILDVNSSEQQYLDNANSYQFDSSEDDKNYITSLNEGVENSLAEDIEDVEDIEDIEDAKNSQSETNGQSFNSLINADISGINFFLRDVANKIKSDKEADVNELFTARTENRIKLMMYSLSDHSKRQLFFEYDEKSIKYIVRCLWLYLYSRFLITSATPNIGNSELQNELECDDYQMIVDYYFNKIEGFLNEYYSSNIDFLNNRGVKSCL